MAKPRTLVSRWTLIILLLLVLVAAFTIVISFQAAPTQSTVAAQQGGTLYLQGLDNFTVDMAQLLQGSAPSSQQLAVDWGSKCGGKKCHKVDWGS